MCFVCPISVTPYGNVPLYCISAVPHSSIEDTDTGEHVVVAFKDPSRDPMQSAGYSFYYGVGLVLNHQIPDKCPQDSPNKDPMLSNTTKGVDTNTFK